MRAAFPGRGRMPSWLHGQDSIEKIPPRISTAGFSGRSEVTRTPDIMLPNLSGKLFLLVYSDFRPFSICFTYSLTLLSPLFPGVPAPSVVIYVVKNASRLVSGEDSPVPDGKRFAFQIVCIVTLSRRLCKRFLQGWQLSSCGAIDKELAGR